MDALINEETRQRAIADWEAIFEAHDVPHAPVMKVGQVLEHPQAKARGMVREVRHSRLGQMRITGRAIHLPAHDQLRFTAAPVLGEHTDEILQGVLGYQSGKVAELRAAGVVA